MHHSELREHYEKAHQDRHCAGLSQGIFSPQGFWDILVSSPARGLHYCRSWLFEILWVDDAVSIGGGIGGWKQGGELYSFVQSQTLKCIWRISKKIQNSPFSAAPPLTKNIRPGRNAIIGWDAKYPPAYWVVLPSEPQETVATS